MNILYITPDQYKSNVRTGGMGTKTTSIISAWSGLNNIDVASSIDEELMPYYDIVMIELLGFRNDGKLEERVEQLKQLTVPILVYGSDSEVFRWSGNDLDMLNSVVTGWLANCQWQQNYMLDFDLPVLGILYEPIDTELFRPSANRQKVIITGGRISYEKESDFFIELFNALKVENIGDYQTAYIGNSGGWGGYDVKNLRLEHELKACVDIFHGQVGQSKVASIMGEAAVTVFEPLYETCHRMGQESAACGIPRICGRHILYDEKLTVARFDTVSQCVDALKSITNGFTELPEPKYGMALREIAVENYSYDATNAKLNEFMEMVT